MSIAVRSPTPPNDTDTGGDEVNSSPFPQLSPRKARRITYARLLGDGREFTLVKMDRQDKPKQETLVAAILERDARQKPKNWSAQQCATWLHEHPSEVFYFVPHNITFFKLLFSGDD
jgi:hypothetical protein